MIRYLCWRLIRLVTTLLVASILVFSGVYLAPGSPLTALTGGRSLTEDQVAALEAQYHLDEPLLSRYWQWLTGVLSGDFGSSLVSRESVTSIVGDRLGTTALLIAGASVIIIVVGLALGLVAALRGGFIDTSVIAITGSMAAIPSFVAATFLITVFGVQLGWFPVLGDGSGLGLWGRVRHLVLPAVALALAATGFCARVTRSSVLTERSQEHVAIARSRGLPASRIVRRHVLRNAMIPITTAVGLTIAGLIAGSVVVEQAFALNGLGTLLVQAVVNHDYAVVQAVTLLMVTGFIVINTLVELTYPLLDPRMRLGDTS